MLSLFAIFSSCNSFAGDLEVPSFNPWVLSVGAFGAIYSVDFKHEVNFVVNFLPGSAAQIFNSYTQQFGYGIDAQVGVQYHFDKWYYIGLEASG